MSIAALAYSHRHLAIARQQTWWAVTITMLTLYSATVESAPRQDGIPLFGGHIHYNQDVWEMIGPENAIERLRAVGIERALVSSTPTEGTERLFKLDPARIVPLLRPYRSPADRRTWFADPGLVPRL